MATFQCKGYRPGDKAMTQDEPRLTVLLASNGSDVSHHAANQFKALLLRDEAQIARNLARQLVVYATGAPSMWSA